MKNFIFMVSFLVGGVVAFGQGVNFEHLTFDEVKAKAKVEKKVVIMDCYTFWCGPGKYMTDNIFRWKKWEIF